MTGHTFILPPDGRESMLARISAFALAAYPGKRVKVTVEEASSKRSLEQNDKFHAVCHELSQTRQWAGKWRDTEAWKRLLVDAWARHEGRIQAEVVPSLDGASVVNLGIQTRRMKVADMADLIEFAESYVAEVA